MRIDGRTRFPQLPRYFNPHSHSVAPDNGLGRIYVVLHITYSRDIPHSLSIHLYRMDTVAELGSHSDGCINNVAQCEKDRRKSESDIQANPFGKHALPISLCFCYPLDIPSTDFSLHLNEYAKPYIPLNTTIFLEKGSIHDFLFPTFSKTPF